LSNGSKAILKVLERLPVPVLIANPVTGRILWVNTGIIRMAEATHPDQFVGKSLFDFIQAPQLSQALADLAKVALRQSPPPVTYHLKKMTGQHAAAQVASIPFVYDGTLAMLSIVTDVSERESVLRELAEAEERYRVLLESLPYGVLVGVDERIVYANPAAARMLEVDSVESLIGSRGVDRVAGVFRERAKELRRSVLAEGQPLSAVVDFEMPEGEQRTFTVSVSRVHWSGEVATQTTLIPGAPCPEGESA
jgi:PAS domain S-box-containing protein